MFLRVSRLSKKRTALHFPINPLIKRLQVTSDFTTQQTIKIFNVECWKIKQPAEKNYQTFWTFLLVYNFFPSKGFPSPL